MRRQFHFGRVTVEGYVDLSCWMIGFNVAMRAKEFGVPSVYLHVGPLIAGFWTNPPERAR